jgi:lauroyl/myristoyl acyltransferase
MAQVQDDVFQTVKNAHHILEDWISARPGQWLWLHRRWKA